MSNALESYKSDNGIYPRSAVSSANNTSTTDSLDPRKYGDPRNVRYQNASRFLYVELSGDVNANYVYGDNPQETGKTYMEFKPAMLGSLSGKKPGDSGYYVDFLSDPFGFAYGYSTSNQANSSSGFNPTYDLWSTGGTVTTSSPITPEMMAKWITNW